MKYEKRLNYLNIFLNIILAAIALPFIIYSPLALRKSINTMDTILQIIIGLMLIGGYIMTILTLKKILKSLCNKDPFNSSNVTNFRKIGYYIFIVGVIHAIISYPKPNNSNLEIMATSYGSIKPIFFLYMVLSILSLILSDVFRMAMEVKDENNLTVWEE